jgi:hypothetical protein
VPEHSLGELSAAAGGSLLRGDPETRVGNFVIDTRKLQPGRASEPTDIVSWAMHSAGERPPR